MSSRVPRVSIGVPVYNGERYLAEALESLVGQTFGDLEIIVCDNASTDRSWEIAWGFAARDPRVRVVRHRENIGAVRNFRAALALARAPLFRWAAADDLSGATATERCVDVLDHDPAVVLAYPRTRLIDESGRPVEDYDDHLHLMADDPVQRFRALDENLRLCNAVYGVVRTTALRHTRPLGTYVSSDEVLLAELTLYGKFYEVPEFLFLRRFHPAATRHMSLPRLRSYYDPASASRYYMRQWRHMWERFRGVLRAPVPRGTQVRLAGYLARSAISARPQLAGEMLASLRAWVSRRRGRTYNRKRAAEDVSGVGPARLPPGGAAPGSPA